MSEEIDIGQMISGSTADVSVSDLSRRGFKKVRVLNQATIKNLIVEAVDRVLVTRQEDISRAEREKVVQESREEFEELVREKVGEEQEKVRRTSEELEAREKEIALLSRELNSLREEHQGLAAARERAEQDRARLEAEVSALEEEVSTLQAEYARVTGGLEGGGAVSQGAGQELTVQPENMTVLSQKVAERDREIERYRSDIQRLTEEIDRTRGRKSGKPQETPDNVGVVELTGMFRDLLHELKTNADKQGKQQASELKESMELLADRIGKGLAAAGRGGGGGPGGSMCDPADDVMAAFFALNQGTGPIETNLGKVESKKAKAKEGVAGSLEKLKSMQKTGGNQGGS